MTKVATQSTTTTVRDSKSGQFVTVKGIGALKGKMTISKKVDLTKPISGAYRPVQSSSRTDNAVDGRTR